MIIVLMPRNRVHVGISSLSLLRRRARVPCFLTNAQGLLDRVVTQHHIWVYCILCTVFRSYSSFASDVFH
jgi:hypothetical protein